VRTSALAAVILLLPCAGARAKVTLGQRIELSAAGASATITRSPLRIAFRDARGRTVLSEVVAPRALAPTPILPSVPPLPTQPIQALPPATSGAVAGATRYAPLSFLVGVEEPAVEPASEWEGDLTSVERSGVEYSARDVLAAARVGAGVRLTVSTDDPSGRRLIVTVSPDGAGAIRVSARPNDPSGVAAMADSFASSRSEAFHGFGGRHDGLDQHGQDFYNWVDQENIGAGSLASPNSPYLFPDGPQAAYYVQSSFVSNRGYGFLLDQTPLSGWRLDSDRPDAWQTEVAAPAIDYVIAPGTMAQAARTLTGITGRQRVPAGWGLGPMLDREVTFPNETAATYEAQVESDLQNIARHHLPLRAYRIEGWQFVPRAFVRGVIARLHARGIEALLYFRAFVGQDSTGTDDPNEFGYAVHRGYVARTATGAPFVFISNFGAPAALIDFTNLAARRWWTGRIDAALDLGADGFMLDFGEQVQPGMRFADGSTGEQMHNRYPIVYQRATRAAVDAYARAHPHRSFFFFTRSGYTGDPGTAAYENANFPGDETTDWSVASGLASQTPDMLNRALGGAYGFGTDIGGYFDIGPYQPTSKQLFLRWAEWAALTPVFRLHGSVHAGVHTPWSYDRQTMAIYEALSKLHLAAVPLIRRLWMQAEVDGLPPTEPLYLAYPGDPRAARQDQEWLLGPDVLVAPVVTEGATSRHVYFPRGCWRRAGTGATVHGPRQRLVTATLAQLPYYFRCGTRPFALPGSPGPGSDHARPPPALTGRAHGADSLRWQLARPATPRTPAGPGASY
jgi:sulfoquinovosidase